MHAHNFLLIIGERTPIYYTRLHYEQSYDMYIYTYEIWSMYYHYVGIHANSLSSTISSYDECKSRMMQTQ
jgi:hypothetical protein